VLPLDHLQRGAEIVEERHRLILPVARGLAARGDVFNWWWRPFPNEERK
jgi:hypothetical protein